MQEDSRAAHAQVSNSCLLVIACSLLGSSTACRPARTPDVLPIEFRLSGAPMLIGEVALPEGEFSLMLPDDLAAGDRISGWFSVSDDERTSHLPAAPGRALADFTVVVNGVTFPLSDSRVHLDLEDGVDELQVTLFDGGGELRAEGRTTVARSRPVSTSPAALGDLPPYCSSTGVIVLTGSLDGDSRSTHVEVGGERLEIWTESPRRATALAFGLPLGEREFRVSEGETEIQGSIHVLHVEIEPMSIEAEGGTRVPYLVVVDGLEGLVAPQAPILSLSAWTEDGSEATVHRDAVVEPRLADAGRVVIRGEFTVAEAGTFHINGGIRSAPPER